jgi:peptidoglycan biosynthesis protein MviN/MurJ (putative lipid II flippase)
MMVHGAFIFGTFSHADIQQPAISRGPVPLFSVVVIIVLIVGAGLFFAPVLVKPGWALGRHAVQCPLPRRLLHRRNGRDGGGLESLVAGRLVLVMAFIFTVIVSVASFINLGYFNFERKVPWLWFWSILLRSLYPGSSCGGPGPVLLQKA